MSLLTQWSHNNYDTLLSLLSKEDKETFNFDVTSFDWDKYVSIACMGTKKYIFKDDLSNLPCARQNIKRCTLFSIYALIYQNDCYYNYITTFNIFFPSIHLHVPVYHHYFMQKKYYSQY